MIIVPSPSSLLHYQKPNYISGIISRSPSNILSHPNPQDNSNVEPLTPQNFLDIAFFSLTESKNPKWEQNFNHQELIQHLYSIDDAKASIFLSTISFSIGDRDNGIYFLTRAATLGSESACNALGTLYMTDPYFHKKSKEEDLTTSLYWFIHAYRRKSYESVRNIGLILELKEEFIKSVHFYVMHFSLEPSFITAELMARVFVRLRHKSTDKLCKYCLSLGSMDCLTYLRNLNPRVWNELYKKSIIKTDVPYEFYVPILADQPSKSKIFSNLQRPEMFYCPTSNAIQYSYRKQPIKNLPKASINSFLIPNFNSQSILITKIFDCASEDFRKRNLSLCQNYIKLLDQKFQINLLNTELWKNKLLSMTRKDLISFGFIESLLGHYQKAYQYFFKAANIGSNVAMTMIGIIEFHGFLNKRNTDFAVKHFLLAPTNPISLAHLAIVYPKEAYLNRLKDIVNSQSEGKIFEWIGDMFWYGIKLPKNNYVAKMFYAIAMKKFEENGEDLIDIIQKLSM